MFSSAFSAAVRSPSVIASTCTSANRRTTQSASIRSRTDRSAWPLQPAENGGDQLRAGVGREPQYPTGRECQLDRGGGCWGDAERDDRRAGISRRGIGSGEPSPPQVEVGLGDVLGRAKGSDGVVTGCEAFEAFAPPPGGGCVGTGMAGRVRHDGILQQKERMPSTINHTSIT